MDKDYNLPIYPNREYGKIVDNKGEVICQYYYNPQLYKDIQFTESSNNKMPVTIITSTSHYQAKDWFNDLEDVLNSLIIVDFATGFVVYLSICIFREKRKNNHKQN